MKKNSFIDFFRFIAINIIEEMRSCTRVLVPGLKSKSEIPFWGKKIFIFCKKNKTLRLGDDQTRLPGLTNRHFTSHQ